MAELSGVSLATVLVRHALEGRRQTVGNTLGMTFDTHAVHDRWQTVMHVVGGGTG